MSYPVIGAAVFSLLMGTPMFERTSTEFVVVGDAGRSCGEYIQAVKAETRARPATPAPGMRYTALYAVFIAVTDGFVTGLNYVDRDRPQLAKIADEQTRMTWLEGYCETNRSVPFIEALQYLRLEMIKKGT